MGFKKKNMELLKKRYVPHRYKTLKPYFFIRKVISPIDKLFVLG